MIGLLALFFTGLFLSALFSGSETGFYRVARLRLVLDANEGSRVAQGLLNLSNNPTLFVATTLIGNNLANYVTSLSIVLMARVLWVDHSQWAELVATLAATPVVFIYGELLPKNLFYYAPNLLLRRSGPLFMLFTLLFAPVSATLWLLGRVVERVLGQKPLRLQSQLARQELRSALAEGEATGLLQPVQQHLTEGLFDIASLPVQRLSVPLASAASVPLDASVAIALETAKQAGVTALVVRQQEQRELAGYVRVIDLRIGDSEDRVVKHLRPLTELPLAATHLAALIKLRTEDEEVAQLVEDGRALSVVFGRDLSAKLLDLR